MDSRRRGERSDFSRLSSQERTRSTAVAGAIAGGAGAGEEAGDGASHGVSDDAESLGGRDEGADEGVDVRDVVDEVVIAAGADRFALAEPSKIRGEEHVPGRREAGRDEVPGAARIHVPVQEQEHDAARRRGLVVEPVHAQPEPVALSVEGRVRHARVVTEPRACAPRNRGVPCVVRAHELAPVACWHVTCQRLGGL